MKLRILRLPCDGDPEVVDIEYNLESLQRLAGGLIEGFPGVTSDERPIRGDCFANEEGLLTQAFGFNPWVRCLGGTRVVGNVFVTGGTDADGEMLDVRDEEVQMWKPLMIGQA